MAEAVPAGLFALVAALMVALVAAFVCRRQQRGWAEAVQRLASGEGQLALPRGRAGAVLRDLTTELQRRERRSAELRERLLTTTEQAQALSTISVLLSSVGGAVEEVANRVVRLAAEVVGDGVILQLVGVGDAAARQYSHHRDPAEARMLVTVGSRAGELAACFEDELVQGEPWVVALQAKQVLLARAQPECRTALRRMSVGSFVAAPVSWGDEQLGVLLLLRKETSPSCSAEEVQLVRDLTSRTAVALANARLLAALTEEATRRRRAELAARRSFARQRELLERMLDLSRLERRRIAADVHDDAVQVMTAALMRLGTARLEMPDDAGTLAHTEELLSTSIGRLRSLLFQLAPPDLTTHGLGSSLRRLADDVFVDDGARVSVDVPDDALEARTGEIVFRIVREALVNAHKHAHAAHVNVRLRHEQDGVRVEVTDDGEGMGTQRAAELRGHFGVASMSERAEAAGGWLRLRSRRRGTTVTFWLPTQGAELASARASGGPG